VSSSRRRARGLDHHWVRSIGFTVALVGLVAVAIGADWTLAVVLVGLSTLGFGFFYLLFPGGAHFGMTIANFLAIYACLFEFFAEANFAEAPHWMTMIARSLPVLAFLLGCFLRRRRVFSLIIARRVRELNHLPRVTRWLVTTLGVGAASFALPRMELDPTLQGLALLLAMTLVALLVMLSVRDVILVLVDIAVVFEGVAKRLDRLVMPIMAFLTFYALIVVVFACFYRIADLTTTIPQFHIQGHPGRIGFVEALYFSVATITTLGFGDIAPAAPLVRALTAAEVVSGILMLLFGFSEIMRSAEPESRAPTHLPPRPPSPSE
jgi:voltage-gated potassium channel